MWGIFVGFWLPDSPMRAKCFSPEDRLLMAERVRENETGIQNKDFKWYQVREAFTDPIVLGTTVISVSQVITAMHSTTQLEVFPSSPTGVHRAVLARSRISSSPLSGT